jgi:hypothetical protein
MASGDEFVGRRGNQKNLLLPGLSSWNSASSFQIWKLKKGLPFGDSPRYFLRCASFED